MQVPTRHTIHESFLMHCLGKPEPSWNGVCNIAESSPEQKVLSSEWVRPPGKKGKALPRVSAQLELQLIYAAIQETEFPKSVFKCL